MNKFYFLNMMGVAKFKTFKIFSFQSSFAVFIKNEFDSHLREVILELLCNHSNFSKKFCLSADYS